ncbi:MAG TPA: hypothetical protein DEO88_02600 [Syntrophobacteraceae bacterium]|nr:hypothetical protein [Syntrophobacteraceae bacterium]
MKKDRCSGGSDLGRKTMNVGSRGEPEEQRDSPMGHDLTADPTLGRIEEALRRMPDLDPPNVLLQSVMGAVRATRLSPWVRVLRWFRAPRSITFTPLQLAPAAVVLIVLCLAFAFYAFKGEKGGLVVQNHPVPVVLALRFPEARTVAVIGSFNGWQPQGCKLTSVNGEAHWTIQLLLPAGRYEYAFVVDGEKIMPDPGAGLHEDDGFGNQNAILFVGNGNGNSA